VFLVSAKQSPEMTAPGCLDMSPHTAQHPLPLPLQHIQIVAIRFRESEPIGTNVDCSAKSLPRSSNRVGQSAELN
jgi:hypothetical protein